MPVHPIELYATDGLRLSGMLHEVPGARTAYAVAHGFTGSARAEPVAAICRQLAARGSSVLAVDFRGHGGSAGRSSIGVEEEWDHAAAVRHLRGAGYERVVSAGWSMGGSVVLRHAALNPDAVDAVVSVSSPGLWYERGTPAMRRVHTAAETGWGRLIVQRLMHTRIGAGRGWETLPESPVELVSRITAPTLLVHGDADHYFPLKHPRALAAAHPAATVWIEPGMGHAESATTPDLVARIDDWVRAALRSAPAHSSSPAGTSGTMDR